MTTDEQFAEIRAFLEGNGYQVVNLGNGRSAVALDNAAPLAALDALRARVQELETALRQTSTESINLARRARASGR